VLQVVALTVMLTLSLQQMGPDKVGLKLVRIFKVKDRVQLLLNAVVVSLDDDWGLVGLKKQG
jgi:hypothetical protein